MGVKYAINKKEKGKEFLGNYFYYRFDSSILFIFQRWKFINILGGGV
jgi:hypothetical protein